jgi:hypothetical protein
MNETGVLFLTGTIIAELRWNVEGRKDIKAQHLLAEQDNSVQAGFELTAY